MLKLMLEIEDARTRIAYLLPAGRSPLEVLRNYQDVVKAAGGEVLYACKSEECGGDPERSSDGGGGDMRHRKGRSQARIRPDAGRDRRPARTTRSSRC